MSIHKTILQFKEAKEVLSLKVGESVILNLKVGEKIFLHLPVQGVEDNNHLLTALNYALSLSDVAIVRQYAAGELSYQLSFANAQAARSFLMTALNYAAESQNTEVTRSYAMQPLSYGMILEGIAEGNYHAIAQLIYMLAFADASITRSYNISPLSYHLQMESIIPENVSGLEALTYLLDLNAVDLIRGYNLTDLAKQMDTESIALIRVLSVGQFSYQQQSTGGQQVFREFPVDPLEYTAEVLPAQLERVYSLSSLNYSIQYEPIEVEQPVADPTAGMTLTESIEVGGSFNQVSAEQVTHSFMIEEFTSAANGICYEQGGAGQGYICYFSQADQMLYLALGLGNATPDADSVRSAVPYSAMPGDTFHVVGVQDRLNRLKTALYINGVQYDPQEIALGLASFGGDSGAYGVVAGAVKGGAVTTALTGAVLASPLSTYRNQVPADFN